MSSPFPTLALCIFYAYFSKVLAPKLMANRKAFDLRNILVVYNLFQTVFSAWIFYEVSIIIRMSNSCLGLFVSLSLFFFFFFLKRAYTQYTYTPYVAVVVDDDNVWSIQCCCYAVVLLCYVLYLAAHGYSASKSLFTANTKKIFFCSFIFSLFIPISFLCLFFSLSLRAVSSQWMVGSLQFQMPACWLFKR